MWTVPLKACNSRDVSPESSSNVFPSLLSPSEPSPPEVRNSPHDDQTSEIQPSETLLQKEPFTELKPFAMLMEPEVTVIEPEVVPMVPEVKLEVKSGFITKNCPPTTSSVFENQDDKTSKDIATKTVTAKSSTTARVCWRFRNLCFELFAI